MKMPSAAGPRSFCPCRACRRIFYQMLLNSPECRLITPVVRKIMLLFWVSRSFEDKSSGGKELRQHSHFFLSTEPCCSSPGGHVPLKLHWWGAAHFPTLLTHRPGKPEKARLCAHLPGFSSESIYAQMQ